MVVLVPWKPVALVFILLSALIFMSYFGSYFGWALHGKNPFVVNTGNS
jgi:hypothetical protein